MRLPSPFPSSRCENMPLDLPWPSSRARPSWTAQLHHHRSEVQERTTWLLPPYQEPLSALGWRLGSSGGPKSLLPGMTTFGIICFGAQYLVNEAEILRIKLIAGYSGGGLQRLQEQARSETSTMADPRSILSSGGAAAAVPATSPSSAASEASSSSSWLSAMSPVRRVSDEEYAARLQAQQEAATARIAALKKEAAELEAQLADSSRAGTGTQ